MNIAGGSHAEDCRLCGAASPVSHVSVQNPLGMRIGRICASHTFYETIMSRANFMINVVQDDEEEEDDGSRDSIG